MLIVDINTLCTVCLLNFTDKVIMNSRNASDCKNVMRIRSTVGKGLTLCNTVAFLNDLTEAVRNKVGFRLAVLAVSDNNVTALLNVLE